MGWLPNNACSGQARSGFVEVIPFGQPVRPARLPLKLALGGDIPSSAEGTVSKVKHFCG